MQRKKISYPAVSRSMAGIFYVVTVFFSLVMGLAAAVAPAVPVQGKVVSYPAAPGSTSSDVYTLTVNGTPVHVEAFTDIHYAQFAFDGECEVVVSIPPSIGHRNLNYINAYDIRPKRREPAAWCDLNTLHFKLQRPTKLVITINEHQRLFLFADAVETNVPAPGQAGVVNLADFATDNTGAALQTEAIARAIAKVAKGGTLYVPPGRYLTGTVVLKSDMTLYLAGGSVLQGSPKPADYPPEQGSWHWANQQFLRISAAENVTVRGPGTLDANGAVVRGRQGWPHLLVARDCRNLRIEDVMVRDPAAWCVNLVDCRGATVRNVKGIGQRSVLNGDGFDVCSGRDILIEDSFQYVSDDAAVVKSCKDRPVERVTVRGCVFLSKKSALKVGTEADADISDVMFADNDVIEADRGMTLASEDGHIIRNTRYINNRFEMPYPDARTRLIDFYTWNRNGVSSIENTLVKDCVADVRWPRPSTLFPASGPINGVHFENFVLEGKVCHNLREADVLVDGLPCSDDRRANVRAITFKPGGPHAGNLVFLKE
jgi:hypothetical protein